jgi:hypothetical protein
MILHGAQALVLGLDPARSSGWATWAPYTVIASGVCTTAPERRAVVAEAQAQAHERELPLVVVYERHTVGGGARWNPETMMGMGEGRGRWLEQLELVEVRRSHIIGVSPGTWRRAALGKASATMKRDELKSMAVMSCRARGFVVESDDQAEAILIALWGAQASAEVRQLAARRRAA